MRTGRVVVDGVGSPTIEAGPADATEAVVFVHGNPGSRTDWASLVARAGEQARAVAFDMPGFGQADKRRDFPCHVGAYAEFIEGARNELGLERLHLVLHDFGGPFGLVWGLQHPESWASVVLLNVGVMPGYTWHTMARRWRTPVLGELVQAWIPRSAWRSAMRRANPRPLPVELVDKMYDDYDRATRRTVLKLYRATPDPGRTANELGAAIAALRKPALVIWGAKDPFIGVEFAERQREFFDVRKLAVLDQSAHWAFQDDPERVEPLVLEFLSGQLSARASG